MRELNLEIAKKAIEKILSIEVRPYLYDRDILIMKELQVGIVFLPWAGIYKTFDIPGSLDIKNNIHDYLAHTVLLSTRKLIMSRSHIFCDSLEEIINGYFDARVNQYFTCEIRNKINNDSEKDLVLDACRYVLNLYDDIDVYTSDRGDEYLVLADSGFVIRQCEYGYYVAEWPLAKNEKSISERIDWRQFNTIDEATTVLLNIIYNIRFRAFWEEIRNSKRYSSVVLN